MTEWRVTWTKSAKKYYERMDSDYQKKVREATKELGSNPILARMLSVYMVNWRDFIGIVLVSLGWSLGL